MIVASANGEEAVIIQLRKMREIVKIFTTNGRWDLAVEIETQSLVEFDQALSKLRQVKGIEETQTSLLLSVRH
jgi:DNA-binding Lrp family transcriptional regulator